MPAPSRLLDTYLDRRGDLLRFFTRRLSSPEAAEDLVQEIYFKLDSVGGEEVRDPAAFLYRLGWNLMLDRLKKARRSAARDSAWASAEVVSLGAFALDAAPRPDAAVEARERLSRLLARLAALPETTRTIFRLHKFDGLSHAETAARLGLSRSSVEKHVSAALKALAEPDDR